MALLAQDGIEHDMQTTSSCNPAKVSDQGYNVNDEDCILMRRMLIEARRNSNGWMPCSELKQQFD
jgi:hypothetical protein